MRHIRATFLRALALVYLIAFVSLAVQVRALIGQRGILPLRDHLAAAGEYIGPGALERALALPTLFWISASDTALLAACLLGALAALALLADLAPLPALLLMWALYLSLVGAGQIFLAFQWDALLLEVGFLALFLAPLRLRPRRPAREREPPAPVIWLFRWLLFRLVLGSGVVKLASGDPHWRGLTALDLHFETQPLPTVFGWFAHQLPAPVHWLMCAAMFAIELLAPFLIFAGRRARQVAAACFVLLQLGIGLTGNYTFFNLLSASLALFLLDDRLLRSTDPAPPPPARPWGFAPLVALIALLSLRPLLSLVGRIPPLPEALLRLESRLQAFRLVNRYGLFAILTTARPELRIEGSEDGLTWREYELRWKPGDPARAPRWVQPHQPRLDWQLWFAALGEWRQNRWMLRVCQRLHEGEPGVLGLFGANPFPQRAPRYLRVSRWEYRMTGLGELRATGMWWRRVPGGDWSPTLDFAARQR